MICKRLIIKGSVQGIGYRFYAKKEAQRCGINGFVKNLEDGDVEIVAEGEENKMKEFIEQCRKGPQLAKIEKVVVEDFESQGEKGFEIRC